MMCSALMIHAWQSQNSMFHQVFPLMQFVLSNAHYCGKRKQLNSLAELLWHTVPPGSVISDLKQMEDGYFPLHCFNQPGTTLSLLHDNRLPHPPCCTWIELGLPLIGAREKIVWWSDGLCIILSPRLSDVAAALWMGATPHAAGLSRLERSPVTKHRDLPTISISKPGSTSSKSETKNLSLHKSSSTHEVQASVCSIDYFDCFYLLCQCNSILGACLQLSLLHRHAGSSHHHIDCLDLLD